MNFLFYAGELARLVPLCRQAGARYGITRAQWAVLAKWNARGLKQSDSRTDGNAADTLTRLIDRLCDNGWIDAAATIRPPGQPALSAQGRAPLLGKRAAALGTDGDRARRHQPGPTPIACSVQLEAIKENVRTPFRIRSVNRRGRSQRVG